MLCSLVTEFKHLFPWLEPKPQTPARLYISYYLGVWVSEPLKGPLTWVGQENEDLDVRGQSRVREPNSALCQLVTLASYLHPPCLGFLECKLGIAGRLPHCVVAKDEMHYVNTAWNSTWNRIYTRSNRYHQLDQGSNFYRIVPCCTCTTQNNSRSVASKYLWNE